MKKNINCFALFILLLSACGGERNGAHSTTDVDSAKEGSSSESPTAATSSAGSSGMGGAVSTHAIASDSAEVGSEDKE